MVVVVVVVVVRLRWSDRIVVVISHVEREVWRHGEDEGEGEERRDWKANVERWRESLC